jgi:pyrrolidone-carboxylate peptidase
MSEIPTFVFAFEPFEGRAFNSSAEYAKNSNLPFVILPVDEEAADIAIEQAISLHGKYKFLVTGEFHGNFIRVDENAVESNEYFPVTWDAMPIANEIGKHHNLPVKKHPTAGNFHCNRVLAALLKNKYEAAIIHIPINLHTLR